MSRSPTPSRALSAAPVTPDTPHRLSLLAGAGLLVLGLLCASQTTRAAEPHADAHATAAKPKPPAAKPAAAPAAPAAKAAAGTSMDQLREKLAERLGATKAPDARSPYVVRVANKSEGGGGHDVAPAAAAAARKRLAEREHATATVHGTAGASQGHGHGHDVHWSYDGAGGPAAWGQLKPEFATCAVGERQSPIDIRDGLPLELQPIEFDYHPSGFSVIDNGHTVQVNLPVGNAINVNGRRYDLLQFHFHRPSEERINGRQFDMVAHLVHKDADGKLAVVAVLLDRGSAHPLIQMVWNALPLEKGVAEPANTQIDLQALLPQDRRYFTYMGSLTTPPCSEGVLWLVMKQPVQLSAQQIGIFARLYPMNARPIQKAAGRLIKEGL